MLPWSCSAGETFKPQSLGESSIGKYPYVMGLFGMTVIGTVIVKIATVRKVVVGIVMSLCTPQSQIFASELCKLLVNTFLHVHNYNITYAAVSSEKNPIVTTVNVRSRHTNTAGLHSNITIRYCHIRQKISWPCINTVGSKRNNKTVYVNVKAQLKLLNASYNHG